MRPTAAPGAFANPLDSEPRRQAPEPEAAATAVSMGPWPAGGRGRSWTEPRATVTAVSMGAGVAEALGTLDPELAGRVEAGLDCGFTGRVAGVFRTGFYVTGDRDAIFAVLGPGAWPGPLHLVTAALPGLPVAGDRVAVAGTTLIADGIEIDFGGARLWDPALPGGLSFDPAVWVDAVPPVDLDLTGVWDEVAAAVHSGDLASACRCLEGRGGGLTPAGDDALAGIMLVTAADRSRRPALWKLACQARTSELSRAFLEWAARGSSIEPAHAVLEAAASGNQAGLVRAARTLTGVGASSGRALLAGLALAASTLPFRPTRSPRPLSSAHSALPLRPAPADSSPAFR